MVGMKADGPFAGKVDGMCVCYFFSPHLTSSELKHVKTAFSRGDPGPTAET